MSLNRKLFAQVGVEMEIELTLSEQLFRLEDRLLQPEVRQSKDEIAKLLADDFIEFGSSGRIFDKTQVLEGLPQSPIIPMTIEKFQIKCLSENVALVTYRVVKTEEPCEEMRYSLRSSIWKLMDGRWQMIFHQGTRMPEF